MKEVFVTHEISIKIKEKGFPLVDYKPTISSVLKWLRDEKNIAVNVEFIPYVWQYKIIDMSFNDRFTPCGVTIFNSYEEAALTGITYVVDNLI